MSVALWQFNDVVFLPFIDNLEVPPFKEAAHLWFAREHYLHQLPDHLLFVALGCGCVPLLQAQLPLPAEQQHEMHLHTHTQGQKQFKSWKGIDREALLSGDLTNIPCR